MSQRRTLILLGALAVGVIAALLLFNYVRGIEDRANQNAKLVDVFVAASPIKRGTAGEEASKNEDIKQDQVPQKTKPDTAIATLDQINKKVALFDIPKGTVITDGMFVDPATSQISFRQRLKDPDYVAMSISTDPIHGVSGFLVPGDEVNMYVFEQIIAGTTGEGETNGTARPAAGAAAAAGAEQKTVVKSKARVLYQKVQIIAVGSQAKLEPGETQTTTSSDQQNQQNASILTLAIPPDASLWIASAQEGGGGIYLALVAEQYKPRVIERIPDIITDLPGENPRQLTPYGPDGNPTK